MPCIGAGSAEEPVAADIRKTRAPRRRKLVEPAPEAEDLFEAAQGSVDAAQSPEPVPQSAPRPRGRPRRKPADLSDIVDPEMRSAPAPLSPTLAADDASAASGTTTDLQTLPAMEAAYAAAEPAQDHDAPFTADAAEPAAGAPDPDEAVAVMREPAEPGAGILVSAAPESDATPEFEAPPQVPAGPRVIGAAEAALATINPNPIRATDRPDTYLYHLTSPAEAQALMQGGLPCSIDDPIILTERGGIPYWMAVLSEDVDDILDGPVAVVVLRVKRRAVQNYLEPDADSTRAAQAPCFLLTGISGLAPMQAPLAPPRPKPAEAGATPADCSPGVEMAGTVKWYNPRKGFGFITPGSGGKDVFVHASTLERSGLSQLNDGQGVRMQVVQGAKGPEAATLSLG